MLDALALGNVLGVRDQSVDVAVVLPLKQIIMTRVVGYRAADFAHKGILSAAVLPPSLPKCQAQAKTDLQAQSQLQQTFRASLSL